MHYDSFPQFKAGLLEAKDFPRDWSDAKIDILFEHYKHARDQATLTVGRLQQTGTDEMRATKGTAFDGGKGQLLLTPKASGFSSTVAPAAATFGKTVVPRGVKASDWEKKSPQEQMDTMMANKWSIWLNDAFILGGIHHHAVFHLVSNMNLQADPTATFPFNVTQRELIGLCTFGYSDVAGDLKAGTEYRCIDTRLADSATFKVYVEQMNKRINAARA